MAKTRVGKNNLLNDNSVDIALFGLPEETENIIVKISANELHGFFDHTFKPLNEKKYLELRASIRENGQLVPIEVRVRELGGYEIIIGHNRVQACKDEQIEYVHAIVKNYTDDEARIRMIDSNIQRDELYPSELAKAYRMKLEIRNRQGKRVDLSEITDEITSVHNEQKLEKRKTSREIVAEELGVSPSELQRYVRLTYLIPALLYYVDEKRISFLVGIDLSYLTEKEQNIVYEFLDFQECNITTKQSNEIKILSKEKSLTKENVKNILKGDAKKPQNIKLRMADISSFFPENISEKEIIDEIIRLLECRTITENM